MAVNLAVNIPVNMVVNMRVNVGVSTVINTIVNEEEEGGVVITTGLPLMTSVVSFSNADGYIH